MPILSLSYSILLWSDITIGRQGRARSSVGSRMDLLTTTGLGNTGMTPQRSRQSLYEKDHLFKSQEKE